MLPYKLVHKKKETNLNFRANLVLVLETPYKVKITCKSVNLPKPWDGILNRNG
jgi:hypothetical protein